MPTKFTMMMNVPNGGFSETWYNSLDFPPDGRTPANFANLALLRTKLLSAQGYMIGHRVTSTTDPRKSSLTIFPAGAVSVEEADVPTTAWLAIAKGLNGVGRRQLWLRGVGDDMVTWDDATKRFVYDGAFANAWSAYKRELTNQNNQWCIRHILGKAEQAGAVFKVVTISSAAGAPGTTLAVPGAPAYTSPIIVAGFKKPLNFLNGTYLPDSGYDIIGFNPVILHKSVTQFQANSYPGGATVRVQSTNLVGVSSLDLEWARERRVGRAFFELHGRRSAR